MTVRGVRQWLNLNDGLSLINEQWGRAYFMDITQDAYTIYLPLPIFNGSINSNGFLNKGFFGENYEYDPVKGQLAFILNDSCEPTYLPTESDETNGLLYRGRRGRNSLNYHDNPLWDIPRSNSYYLSPWAATLYKVQLYGAVVKITDVISETNGVNHSKLNVYRNIYEEPSGEFNESAVIQSDGLPPMMLRYIDAPHTDEWKLYNLAGTTYAFNSDKSKSVPISGRGLPETVTMLFNTGVDKTQKIFVSGTLLNDLLFTKKYDVIDELTNVEPVYKGKYVKESAVLKLTRERGSNGEEPLE